MKKQLITTLTFSLCLFSSVFAQVDSTAFLFAQFEPATIVFRNKTHSKEKVNYNLIEDKLFFVDNKTGEVLAVSNHANIMVVKIGNRNFIYDKNNFVEVLPTDPIIHVQYNAKKRSEAAEGAYGGKSETAAVNSYSKMTRDGGQYSLKGPKLLISDYYNTYWVQIKGKMKKFITPKQFVNLYKNNKDEIEKYIDDNNVDFKNVDQVVKLCEYANKL